MRRNDVLPKLSAQAIKQRAADAQQRTSAPIVLESCSLEDDDFVRVDYAARRYYIPPKGYGTHPATQENKLWDGQLEIRDEMGVDEIDYDDKGESLQRTARNPNAPRRRVAIRAYEAVAFILANRQDRGVFQITGNDEEDEKTRHATTARWVAWRRHDAQRMLLTYHQKQRNAREQPGVVVEPMDDVQIKAQDFMDAFNDPNGPYDKYKGAISGHALRCKENDNKCGYSKRDDAAGRKAFLRHMLVTHKLDDADVIANRYFPEDDEDDDDDKPAKGKKGRK
jgi:hypothetical protein